MRVFISICVVVMGLASLPGCSPPKLIETSRSVPEVQAPTSSAAQTAITLPVSINAVMVALVDHASEPLWVDAYKNPKNADGWREAEYDAYQMAVSGKLIQLAGTGPSDADWVTQPEWKSYANDLSAAGMDALKAAQAKDVKSLGEAGDRLVAACETCHKKFKPGLTSMGIYKSPSYPLKAL